MSEEGEDSGERSHEATERRLEQARKQGDTPRSADLTTAAAYAGFTLAAMVLGGGALTALGGTLAAMLGQSGALADNLFGGSAVPVLGPWFAQVIADSAVWFALPAACALGIVIAQRPGIASARLAPKLSRISPGAAVKQKFGSAGLAEFLKSLVKLTVMSAVLIDHVLRHLPQIAGLAGQAPHVALSGLAPLLAGFFQRITVAALVIGLADFVWQHMSFRRRNRMTRKEMLDEFKESEGDPAHKQQRRARAVAIATAPLRKAVSGADVVIVNPTHFAVALAWDRARSGAPRCVAKGVDDIAAQIRAIAAECAIPIHADPPTARALFADLAVGQEIARSHYRAVAAAIRFADTLRARAKR